MTAKVTDKIKDDVLASLSPEDVWLDYFEDWRDGAPVRCPFHDDDKPSLSLSANGKGYCHGCEWKCSSPVGFVSDAEGISFKKALKRVRTKYVGDVVPAREWTGWHNDLLESKALLRELERTRGITREIVKRFKLGWNGKRLTIPVMDEMGCCVNVRMHDALRRCKEGSLKTVSYRRGTGSARLFPLDSLSAKNAKVYLFEGELDTLLALRHGLPAVCVTAGAKVWKKKFKQHFRDRKVVVCHDVNDKDGSGQSGAEKKCASLAGTATWVKNVRLPIDDRGGDFSDYILKHGHGISDFLQLEQDTPYYAAPKEPDQGPGETKDRYKKARAVTLKEAAHPENFSKPIKLSCLVASMDLAPYVPPRKVTMQCNEFPRHQAAGKIPPKCGACWMPEAGLRKQLEFPPESRELIAMLDKPDSQAEAAVRQMADVPQECDVDVRVDEVYNVHMVGIIPNVDDDQRDRHEYVLRTGYYFGKDMEANKSYQFRGFSMSHPQSQQVTHVFVKAKSTLSAVDKFKLTRDRAGELDSLFRHGGDPYEKLMEIYDDFSRRVTKIVERPMLHAAADLVWHSPLEFTFNGEHVRKGWLEAAIFGDTRCGKGFVAEGLARHYGLGEVVSGENCTVAGLIGGLETLGRRLMLRWGAIPLNDRGLVIIDEAGDMSQDIFPRMSRVRSEGVAEVTKIGHHQRTFARTRLLWLFNPREGTMADYTYGVQALQSVVGKAEDVARFDYAFAVADGEVPSATINLAKPEPLPSAFPRAECRDLVYWCWSRKPDQVRFTKKAVREILRVHSRDFAKKYHPSLPLVQGQNIRVKLAKMAAAVAGRVFSHPKGRPSVMLVDSKCVDAAATLLDEFYKSRAMGYDSYSRKARAELELSNTRELQQLFSSSLRPRNALMLVRCLLSRRLLSVRSIAAASGMDRQEAEHSVVDPLLRSNAITERSNGYMVIRPAFKQWLERAERRLEEELEG